MIDSWIIITAALAYLGFLFAVAYFGDRQARLKKNSGGRPVIYALSLAVYCTSWTFFGSVGLSATTGLDFLPVYVGPIVMIGLCWPLLQRIIRLSKTQNITSIADFIASRYGKSPALASIVTVIAVAGTIPYIALQLKAVSQSVTTVIGPLGGPAAEAGGWPIGDVAFFIAVAMALFAILFGTRHIDATEHQEGLMLAIATESVVKIFTFLLVGGYVTFYMAGGLGPLFHKASMNPEIAELFAGGFHGGTWLTVTFLSLVCVILLPRQFHVAVVENNSEREIRCAAWLFPLYLIGINLFVVPIAMAGLLAFPDGSVAGDMFVLALPLSAGSEVMTLVAFVGGLSAATAMVIVATVALSIMISNDVVVPLLLRRGQILMSDRENMGGLLLNVRRGAIFAILILAYIFYRMISGSFPLASIGLLSFAATAQFAPAFFGGLIWRRGTANGAIAGIVAGFAVWSYTLLLPSFIKSGWLSADILEHGPYGLAFLRPQMLFYFDFEPLTHGVVCSILVNLIAYITISLLRAPEPIERVQANVFIQDDPARSQTPAFRLWRTTITTGELQRTVARYLGEERASRSFAEFAAKRGEGIDLHAEADVQLLRFTEHLLASAIGAASSRLVLSLLLRRRAVGMKSALKLLDDASEAIQYNRDMLQSALDQVRQGIAVFDKDMRLICWNRQFREILDLPPELGRVGVPLDAIVRSSAERESGSGMIEDIVSDHLRKYAVTQETFQVRLGAEANGPVVEVRTNTMPQGGIVATYTDITERVEAAEALARANETLERRVHERTLELTMVNHELAKAKAKADEANLDKTRFLAAAGHDILQPLNAARLYTTSLVERRRRGEEKRLLGNIDASLEAVEDIINALLDISRLDTGRMRPEFGVFPVDELLQQLKLEFEPMARDRRLTFKLQSSGLYVRSDKRLLRRVLQNLVSNAIKYTRSGKVLIGCRRRGDHIEVQVHDTGPGIPVEKQGLVFQEFQRLEANSAGTRGLGLGLSIVERVGRVLDHPIALHSEAGKGSLFTVAIPVADAIEAQARQVRAREPAGKIAGMSVLCIDNEPDILDGMEALLSNWGCNVITAHGSETAIERLRVTRTAPDLVLADYHLENETGLTAIRAVNEALNADIAAVIISADRSLEVQERVRAMGLQMLGKPLRPAALRAVMAQARIKAAAAAE